MSGLRAAPAADRLARAYARETGGRDRTPVRRALGAARRLRLLAGDPPVRYVLDGTPLLLPLSHDLPIHRARHPHYSEDLGTVAAVVARSDPAATLVDIGANVGDSVAIVRAHTAMPILCVEGDEVFLPYLRANVGGLADVEVAAEYVALGGGGPVGVERSHGTAHLVQGSGADAATALRDLEAIVADHPRFARPRMVKVDTDGHDAAILLAALPLLERVRPVLFFEHDPELARNLGAAEPLALVDALIDLGYRHLVTWSNTGELISSGPATRDGDLHERSRRLGPGSVPAYFDVLALHADDIALADQIVDAVAARPQPSRRS